MFSAAYVRAVTICAMLALLTSTWLSAQRSTYRQYGPLDGLNNMVIDCLFQDRTGYIWVGTDNGLFRYDGGAFHMFGHAEGLPFTEILGLAESPEGVLWVATAGGVARRDGRQFKSVDVGEKGRFKAIAFDRLGSMYLANSAGIVRGQPDGKGSYAFQTVVRGTTTGLFVKGEDVWFGKDGELWHMKGYRAEGIGLAAGLPVERWGAITEDSSANLWVRSPTRLYELPRGQTRFINASNGTQNSEDSLLYADSHGRLFVSSDSGLMVVNGSQRTFMDARHGLPEDSVGPVLVDREESLWVGMSGNGLVRRLGHGEWLSWKREDGLIHNSVWAIQRDGAGLLWVGTAGGLNILDQKGRVVHSWTTSNGLAGDRVLTIVEGPKGDFYVGTAPAGISHFNKQGILLHTYGAESGLNLNRINSAAIDREGRLWAVGHGGCFRSRDPVDAAALKFESVDIPGIISAQTSFRLVLADANGIWLGTSRGLARLNGNRWTVFTEKDGLRSDDVASAALEHGALWVSYRDALGISRLQFDGDRIHATHVSMKEGLTSDQVYSLAFDAAGRLWASSDNGVDIFERGRWRHYGTEDGLIWNDTNALALSIDREGSVWVGTSEGLSRYARLPYPVPDSTPPVVLTSIEGGGHEWNSGDRPVLPYSHRSLFIRYSGLSYVSGSRIRFRYRLVGYESPWTETRERSVRFAGLPAGYYVFEVVAAGSNGLWSPVPARFSFSVEAPLWQSWRFILPCLLMFLFLANWLWRARVRSLVAQKELLEQQIAERTAELRESHRQLEQFAYFDVLTALPNRRLFTEEFRKRLALSSRSGNSFALLLIDLNRFKHVNDTFGHDAGDAVLIETGIRLRAAVRESDCVARLGGDEFGILLVSAHEQADIEVICKRIVDGFAVAIQFKGASLEVGSSVGVAIYPQDGDMQETLYKSADLALYETKRSTVTLGHVRRHEQIVAPEKQPQLR